MQIDPEDFKRHYALLSDEALLEIDRGQLVDVARICYDQELAERQLIPAEPEASAQSSQAGAPAEGELQLAGVFRSLEEANFARGLLESAGIPCFFENERGAAWTGAGELRLMVRASDYDQACEILETEISEEDLIAQAESEVTEKSAEDD